MRKPIFETLEFNDIFEEYRILSKWDKVRKNTRDDYNLGAGWYFVCGSWKRDENGKMDFVVVYGKARKEIKERLENMCCEGAIGSMMLRQVGDKPIFACFSDVLMIASGRFCNEVTNVPADVAELV